MEIEDKVITRKVFGKLFTLKVGMKVKVVRLMTKHRRKNLKSYLGKTGTLIEISDIYLEDGRKITIYDVQFKHSRPYKGFTSYVGFFLDELEVVWDRL